MLGTPQQVPAVLAGLGQHRQPRRRELERHAGREPQVSLVDDNDPGRQVEQLLRAERPAPLGVDRIVREHGPAPAGQRERAPGQGVRLARPGPAYIALNHETITTSPCSASRCPTYHVNGRRPMAPSHPGSPSPASESALRPTYRRRRVPTASRASSAAGGYPPAGQAPQPLASRVTATSRTAQGHHHQRAPATRTTAPTAYRVSTLGESIHGTTSGRTTPTAKIPPCRHVSRRTSAPASTKKMGSASRPTVTRTSWSPPSRAT